MTQKPLSVFAESLSEAEEEELLEILLARRNARLARQMVPPEVLRARDVVLSDFKKWKEEGKS